jgi:CRP-like cAMP-binding protein
VFLDESEAYKGESIYFIADGSIRLFMNSAASFKDQEVFLAKLKSGEHFGEYSFITG